MPVINVNGVMVTVEGAETGSHELTQIQHTLEMLPAHHLRRIPVISVGNRPPLGGGGAANDQMPGGPYIRLNRMVFDPAQRRVNSGFLNYSLLHECGHIIDWAYSCMPSMQTEDPIGYRALMQHHHTGRIQGPGEHYADGYADYFFRLMPNRAVPHSVFVTQSSDARMQAIANSRAFRNFMEHVFEDLLR